MKEKGKDSLLATYFNQANEYSRHGQYYKAKDFLIKCNELRPNDIIILNSLAILEGDLKNIDEAERYFLKIIRIDSSYTTAYINFGVLYNKNKKSKEAIKILKKGLSMENDPTMKVYFNYNIANAYYKLDNYEKSFFHNEVALSLAPESFIRKEILELKRVLIKKMKNIN